MGIKKGCNLIGYTLAGFCSHYDRGLYAIVFAHLINETSKGLLCFIIGWRVGLGGLALGFAPYGDLGLAVFDLSR